MRFSIVTPSLNQSTWLRLCVSSVADQDISHEHIVQDAGSGDGTLDWLLKDGRVRACVEKDDGMYDAVNRGWRHATGEFLAYLNCDEQYLPGALQHVADWFDHHPDCDIVFGDVIKTHGDGSFHSARRMQTPLLYHTWTTQLSTLTCATFLRRSVFERGFAFDPAWRAGGDGEWMVRMLRAGVRMGTLGSYTSVFTETGKNMSAGGRAREEALRLRRSAPAWARAARPVLVVHHRLRRLLGGMYGSPPKTYSIYTPTLPAKRLDFRP